MTQKTFLLDMDGVLVRGRTPFEGAQSFIDRLNETERRYLILTKNPVYTPGDLSHRLAAEGFRAPAERIFTSAMATARFFVLGEAGLTTALHGVGYALTDLEPDPVVRGEGRLDLEATTTATRLEYGGAVFAVTNPMSPARRRTGSPRPPARPLRPSGRRPGWSRASSASRTPSCSGPPSAIWTSTPRTPVVVGDNLRTDIRGGIEAGLETALVSSGMTAQADIAKSPVRPCHAVDSVAEIDLDCA